MMEARVGASGGRRKCDYLFFRLRRDVAAKSDLCECLESTSKANCSDLKVMVVTPA